jgi:PAS domain S-box-containing protein
LNGNPEDVPFASLYLLTHGEITEAGSTCAVGPASDPARWPLATVAGLQTPVLLEDLPDRVGTVLCPPWSEPVTRGYLLPLRITGSSTLAVLLLGISPRLPFDDKYETFFKLVGHRIAELLQSEIHQVEIARAAKRFSGLVEANPFGMMIAGLDGSISFVNPAFLDTLGYTQVEVVEGRVRWDKLTPSEYAAADARAVQQIRTLGRCEVYEQALIAKDGHRVPILVGAAALRHSSPHLEVARFITDLTPLKKAEEALRAANEDLEKKITERTAALEAEIVERKRAEKNLQELTGLLLRTQDEERRRMALELHDHAGQSLAALNMNLSALQRATGQMDNRIIRLAEESKQISSDLSTEIRTLSYLLHPPLLDESGISSALQWFVDGFSERSGIKVDLNLPENLGRLPRELELVIFRVV